MASGKFKQNLNNDIDFEAERLMKERSRSGPIEKEAAKLALLSDDSCRFISQELCDLEGLSPVHLLKNKPSGLPLRNIHGSKTKRFDPMDLNVQDK